MKRVSAGEIHISPSDEGKKIVAMDMDTYYNMSIVHTSQDQEVTWNHLQDTQRELRAHSRALARIFQLGQAHSERNGVRCFDNISSWAADPPIMRCQAKTHKPPTSDGTPKSRPIVGAAHGLTTAIGDMISDILTPLARGDPSQTEAQSTEELL